MNYVGVGLIGLISGILGGLLGVGGGILMVPAMVYFLRFDTKHAIGTSMAVIIPIALSGTLKHASNGYVNWKAGLLLAPLAIVGGLIGAHLTGQLSNAALRRLFGGFLIAIGIYMAFFSRK